MGPTKAFFAGFDTTGKIGFWTTNGTVAGTRELVSGLQGSVSLSPHDIVAFGDGAVFAGDDSTGDTGLWATFGANPVAGEVVAGKQGNYALDPEWLTQLGNEILFAGRDSTGNVGLWATDEINSGAVFGTTEILGGPQALIDPFPSGFVVAGNLMFFEGTDSGGMRGLWVTNGTAAGTKEIETGEQGSYSLSPLWITQFGDSIVLNGEGFVRLSRTLDFQRDDDD